MGRVFGEAGWAPNNIDLKPAEAADSENRAIRGGAGDVLGPVADRADDYGAFDHGAGAVSGDESEGVAFGTGGSLSRGAHTANPHSLHTEDPAGIRCALVQGQLPEHTPGVRIRCGGQSPRSIITTLFAETQESHEHQLYVGLAPC